MPPTGRPDARALGLEAFLRKEISGVELFARPEISDLSILLTYRCPAACDHCLFSCSMARRERLDPAVARALIEAGSRQDPPPSVSFSGGEPFLELETMADLGALARDRGMRWQVISSSAWAADAPHARRVLADLKRRGLAAYATTVDRYHTPFVPPARMRHAILAALDLGLSVGLHTTVDPRRRGREEEYLAATLDLPAADVARCTVNKMIAVPAGRARTRVKDFLFRAGDLAEACPFSTEIVTLTPLGYLYPCCGMVLAEDPADARLFIHDSLLGKTPEEVAAALKALKRDLFFKMLQLLGPYRLLKIARGRDPGLRVRRRYTGSCDVCLELTRNRRAIRAIEAFLPECAAALAGATPRLNHPRARV